MALRLVTTPRGVCLPVKVVPGSSRTRLAGQLDGALKVTIAAPPEKGAANKTLLRLLADTLGVRLGQLGILRGQASSQKLVLIKGLSEAEVALKLES